MYDPPPEILCSTAPVILHIFKTKLDGSLPSTGKLLEISRNLTLKVKWSVSRSAVLLIWELPTAQAAHISSTVLLPQIFTVHSWKRYKGDGSNQLQMSVLSNDSNILNIISVLFVSHVWGYWENHTWSRHHKRDKCHTHLEGLTT